MLTQLDLSYHLLQVPCLEPYSLNILVEKPSAPRYIKDKAAEVCFCLFLFFVPKKITKIRLKCHSLRCLIPPVFLYIKREKDSVCSFYESFVPMHTQESRAKKIPVCFLLVGQIMLNHPLFGYISREKFYNQKDFEVFFNLLFYLNGS